jgi:hypothetical protein
MLKDRLSTIEIIEDYEGPETYDETSNEKLNDVMEKDYENKI